MRRDVRILLVGDSALSLCLGRYAQPTEIMVVAAGVGKSTIVTSLIKESYVAHVSVSDMDISDGGSYYTPRSNMSCQKLLSHQRSPRRA